MKSKQAKLTRREFLKATGAVLGGAAVSSALAACVPAPAPEPAAPAVTEAPAVSEGLVTEKAEPITILINDSPWFPGFERLVEYYEEQTGNTVNLDVTPFPGMLEKTTNSVTAGESEHDILNLNEGWYATFYDGGFIAPINDIEPDFELDPKIIEYDYSTRWNHDKKWSTEDGILYGLPINGNIQLFYYREDLYEEAGLAPPETWEDVAAAAEQYTDKPNFYGYCIRGQKAGSSVTFGFAAFLRSFGGDWFVNPPDDWTIGINSPEALNALNKFLELGRNYGPPNLADIGQSDLIQLLITDKLLQNIMVVAAWPNVDDEEKSLVVDKVNTTVCPRPAEGGKNATTSGIWVMGIPKNLPDSRKTSALTFLKWALTFENQMEYTKFGAVPVRQDVYDSDLGEQRKFRWMKAMAASTPHIYPSMKFPESPQLLESTELRLNQAVAGELEPVEALETMAQEFLDVMEKAGYPVKMA